MAISYSLFVLHSRLIVKISGMYCTTNTVRVGRAMLKMMDKIVSCSEETSITKEKRDIIFVPVVIVLFVGITIYLIYLNTTGIGRHHFLLARGSNFVLA